MNALLFSLPGTPVLYYGDEIGMGDNIYLGDRDGVRTPMQWSADRNAGFSRANPQKLYLPVIIDPEYHYESINVRGAAGQPVVALVVDEAADRAAQGVRGARDAARIEFLYPDNHKVLAFVRRDGRSSVLVVINLSRFAQGAELDLSAYLGADAGRDVRPHAVPGDRRPALLLVARAAQLLLVHARARPTRRAATVQPQMPRAGGDRRLASASSASAPRAQLSRGLLDYAVGRRWFRGKARPRKGARIADVVPLDGQRGCAQLVLLRGRLRRGRSRALRRAAVVHRSGEEAHRGVMRDRPRPRSRSL